jgi:hypothetical protein
VPREPGTRFVAIWGPPGGDGEFWVSDVETGLMRWMP